MTFSLPISESHFSNLDSTLTNNFDPTGFQLCELEMLYAKANNIEVTQHGLGHYTISTPWMKSVNHPKIKVDHSFLSIRCAFSGNAREQLMMHKHRYPSLVKLLHVKTKFGADVSLEYIDTDSHEYFEVLHLEKDCYDNDELTGWIGKVESELCRDQGFWDRKIELIKIIEYNIIEYNTHLYSDDQSDIKARIFGFNRTYETLKSVVTKLS